jgi:hypothetical protein
MSPGYLSPGETHACTGRFRFGSGDGVRDVGREKNGATEVAPFSSSLLITEQIPRSAE